MSEQRPEHHREPAEDAEEDVRAPGVQRLGDPANPGATESTNAGRRPGRHPHEPTDDGSAPSAPGCAANNRLRTGARRIDD
jgi:hypothetical protein